MSTGKEIQGSVCFSIMATIGGLFILMAASTVVESKKMMTYPLLMPHVRPTVVSKFTVNNVRWPQMCNIL